jgi:CheY-like chemotaxis protein
LAVANSTAKRILVVEDEKAIARALELKLDHSGFDAVIATGGQAALDLLEKEQFGLILLDLIMPGLDGFAVLQQLKDRGSKIPVIILTNLNQPEDITKAKALGAVDFLIKSDVPLANVVQRAQQILDVGSQ